jgi:hypothetical protein
MALAELEFDHTIFNEQHKGDDKLYVRFFNDIVPDPDKSAETGMRKYRDATMIQIMVPGDKRNIVVREAHEGDKQRFSKLYERFADGKGEHVDGYPLAQWPLASRAMVEELKWLGFQTVEQVAGANDASCSKYPGLRELKARAESWVAAQQGAAPIEKLNTELEKSNTQVAALQQQMAEMAAQMAKLNAAAPVAAKKA